LYFAIQGYENVILRRPAHCRIQKNARFSLRTVHPLFSGAVFRYTADMEHQLNIPLEIFRAVGVFAAFWGGFYRLVRPEARWRWITLLLTMLVFRPVWFFTGVILQDILSGALGLVWILACFGIFIGLCDRPGRAAVTLVYYAGILLYIDVLFRCVMTLYSGGGLPITTRRSGS
jgi:hypothetical protein